MFVEVRGITSLHRVLCEAKLSMVFMSYIRL